MTQRTPVTIEQADRQNGISAYQFCIQCVARQKQSYNGSPNEALFARQLCTLHSVVAFHCSSETHRLTVTEDTVLCRRCYIVCNSGRRRTRQAPVKLSSR